MTNFLIEGRSLQANVCILSKANLFVSSKVYCKTYRVYFETGMNVKAECIVFVNSIKLSNLISWAKRNSQININCNFSGNSGFPLALGRRENRSFSSQGKVREFSNFIRKSGKSWTIYLISQEKLYQK